MKLNLDEWEEIQPAPKAAAVAKEPVRFCLKQLRNGWRGSVLVRRAVLEQLRMQTWRVDIRAGRGANRDRLAVVPSENGKFELTELGVAKGGGVFSVNFPAPSGWGEIDMPMCGCEFRIGDIQGTRKALFIDLPKPVWDPAAARQLLDARAG